MTPSQWGYPFLWWWVRRLGLWPRACVAPSRLELWTLRGPCPQSLLAGWEAWVPGREEQVGKHRCREGTEGELGSLETGPTRTGPILAGQGFYDRLPFFL